MHVLVYQAEGCFWAPNREVLYLFHWRPKHAYVGDLRCPTSYWTTAAMDGPWRVVWQEADRWERPNFLYFSYYALLSVYSFSTSCWLFSAVFENPLSFLYRDIQAPSGYKFCMCHGTPGWRPQPHNSAFHSPLQLPILHWNGRCQQKNYFLHHSRQLDGWVIFSSYLCVWINCKATFSDFYKLRLWKELTTVVTESSFFFRWKYE